jgi:hypothetical protein
MPKTLSELSFTSIREKPEKGQLPRCFWNVTPAGNFAADNALGTKLGLEYLSFEEEDVDGPGILNQIVNDMPRPLTVVERSFLQMVCFQARAGRGYARRLKSYWDNCKAEEADDAEA